MPSSIRPPEMLSIVAAVMAVMAGVRPGIWKMAEPSLSFSVCAPSQVEHGGGVRAVRLGGPDGVEAGGLGLADDLQLLGGGQPETPVPDVQTKTHVATLLSDAGTALNRPTRAPTVTGREATASYSARA